MSCAPRSARLFLLFSVLLLIGLPVEAKDKFKARYRVSAVSEYTDNLFHLSNDELDEFDMKQDPGEQFFDMDGTDDVVTRLRLRIDLSWKVAKKRDFELMLRGSYYTHVQNKISNYPRLDLGFRYDITRVDLLYGGIDVIVDRFWKNYKIADSIEFAPAIYDQAVATIGYARDLNKRWVAGVEYRHRRRDYEPPLESRDRDGNYLVGYTTYDMSRWSTGETIAHYGDIDTPTELDFGIPEDRSYTELLGEQNFRFWLSLRTFLDLHLQYRQRNASTPFKEDLARYNRVDRRYRVQIAVGAELLKGLVLQGRVGYTLNESDRIDPSIITDEVGYNEATAGIGLRYQF